MFAFDSSYNSNSTCAASQRRVRNMWTEDEIRRLLIGVLMFGIGKWADIHKSMGFSDRRTYTDLKDKWRNLMDTRTNSKSPFGMIVIARFLDSFIAQHGGRNYCLPTGYFSDLTNLDVIFSELKSYALGQAPDISLMSQPHESYIFDDFPGYDFFSW